MKYILLFVLSFRVWVEIVLNLFHKYIVSITMQSTPLLVLTSLENDLDLLSIHFRYAN